MTVRGTGERIYRLPAWIRRVTQDLSVSPTYDAIFWNPEHPYTFKHPRPKRPSTLRVYEAHGKPNYNHHSFLKTMIITSALI